MITIQLNGDFLDLFPNTPFKVTHSGFNIGDLSRRDVSYTSSINLPLTEKNRRKLQIFKGDKSLPAQAYNKLFLTVYDSGVSIFWGLCRIKKIGDSTVEIFGVGDEANVFDALKDFNLSDRSLFAQYGTNTIASFYTYRSSVFGLMAPVMNGGKATAAPSTFLKNNSFADSEQTPWTIEEFWAASIAWTFTTGQMAVVLAANQNSKLLHNPTIKFYAGYKYRIVLNINLSGSLLTYLRVYTKVPLLDGGLNDIAGGVSYNTFGNKTVTIDFDNSVNGWNGEGIYIMFFRDATAGSHTLTVYDVTITRVTPASLDLQLAYKPGVSLMNLLTYGLKEVCTGQTNSENSFDITTPQSDYLYSLALVSSRSNGNYPEGWQDQRTVIVKGPGTQAFTLGSSGTAFLTLDTVTKPGLGTLASNTYTWPNTSDNYYVDIVVEVTINVTAYTASAIGKLQIYLNSGGTQINSVESFTSTGRVTMAVRTFAESDSLTKGYPTDAANMSARIVNTAASGSFTLTVESVTVTATPVPYPQDEVMDLAQYHSPDITPFDLLKDFVMRTGSMVRYNRRNDYIQFKPVDAVIRNKNSAVDWTSKRVIMSDDRLEFDLAGYAQTNYIQDADHETNGDARAVLSVVNQNIRNESVLFESSMETKVDRNVLGINMVDEGMFNEESQFWINRNWQAVGQASRERTYDIAETKFLVKTDNNAATNITVKYGSTTAAAYKVGTYATWDQFKTLFYGRLEYALQNIQVATRTYNLDKNDMGKFDAWNLVYDNGCYWMVINLSYSPGQLTKVKMFRVY